MIGRRRWLNPDSHITSIQRKKKLRGFLQQCESQGILESRGNIALYFMKLIRKMYFFDYYI